MTVISRVYDRLRRDEGVRRFAYDDSTGKTVSCKPAGALTIGVGINLEFGLDEDEIEWLCKRRISSLADPLSSRDWYRGLDEVRQSVCVEIAFNSGLSGLLNGFPNLIAALRLKNWSAARIECHVADPRLAARYENLGNILLTGVDS